MGAVCCGASDGKAPGGAMPAANNAAADAKQHEQQVQLLKHNQQQHQLQNGAAANDNSQSHSSAVIMVSGSIPSAASPLGLGTHSKVGAPGSMPSTSSYSLHNRNRASYGSGHAMLGNSVNASLFSPQSLKMPYGRRPNQVGIIGIPTKLIEPETIAIVRQFWLKIVDAESNINSGSGGGGSGNYGGGSADAAELAKRRNRRASTRGSSDLPAAAAATAAASSASAVASAATATTVAAASAAGGTSTDAAGTSSGAAHSSDALSPDLIDVQLNGKSGRGSSDANASGAHSAPALSITTAAATTGEPQSPLSPTTTLVRLFQPVTAAVRLTAQLRPEAVQISVQVDEDGSVHLSLTVEEASAEEDEQRADDALATAANAVLQSLHHPDAMQPPASSPLSSTAGMQGPQGDDAAQIASVPVMRLSPPTASGLEKTHSRTNSTSGRLAHPSASAAPQSSDMSSTGSLAQPSKLVQFYNVFYERLFLVCPGSRSMFSAATIKSQVQHTTQISAHRRVACIVLRNDATAASAATTTDDKFDTTSD